MVKELEDAPARRSRRPPRLRSGGSGGASRPTRASTRPCGPPAPCSRSTRRADARRRSVTTGCAAGRRAGVLARRGLPRRAGRARRRGAGRAGALAARAGAAQSARRARRRARRRHREPRPRRRGCAARGRDRGGSCPSSGSMPRATRAGPRGARRARSGSAAAAFRSPSSGTATISRQLSTCRDSERGLHMARVLAACMLPALAIAVAWLRVEEPRIAGSSARRRARSRSRRRSSRAAGSAPSAVPLRCGRRLDRVRQRAVGAPAVPRRAGLGPLPRPSEPGIAGFYASSSRSSPPGAPRCTASCSPRSSASCSPSAARRRAAAGRRRGRDGRGRRLARDAHERARRALGALALAAALSIPLVLRARSGPSLVAGVPAAAVVVAGAAVGSSAATSRARSGARLGDMGLPRARRPRRPGVRFVWDSNYDGIEFPPKKTVVLSVEGPEQRALLARVDARPVRDDHWFEDLFWLGRVETTEPFPRDRLSRSTERDRSADRLKALAESRELARAADRGQGARGRPPRRGRHAASRVDAPASGRCSCSPEACCGLGAARQRARYRVWSYAPDPAPAGARGVPAPLPDRRLAIPRFDDRRFPPFGAPGAASVVRQLFEDPSYAPSPPYAALYETARRVVGERRTPYGAVLALESWFRQRGGVHLRRAAAARAGPSARRLRDPDESRLLPALRGRDGADAADARHPARVAVGFTSGTREDGTWVVTDHEAHAWVEVWFARPWLGARSTRRPDAGRSAATTRSPRTRRGRGRRARPGRSALGGAARARARPISARPPRRHSFGERSRAVALRVLLLGGGALGAPRRSSGRWFLRPAPLPDRATPAARRRRAGSSWRRSSAIRVSRSPRARRSTISGGSDASSVSTAARSPRRPRRRASARPSTPPPAARSRRGGSCARCFAGRGSSFRCGRGFAASCHCGRSVAELA